MSKIDVEFTDDELRIMAIDYKSLIDVNILMTRSVVGSKILEFKLNADDKTREKIFRKLKEYLPNNSLQQEKEGEK